VINNASISASVGTYQRVFARPIVSFTSLSMSSSSKKAREFPELNK
jgi:hypothetical protein